jgi:hypothetical protein
MSAAAQLVRRLTGGPGAVRASIGIGTTAEHIARRAAALHHLAAGARPQLGRAS